MRLECWKVIKKWICGIKSSERHQLLCHKSIFFAKQGSLLVDYCHKSIFSAIMRFNKLDSIFLFCHYLSARIELTNYQITYYRNCQTAEDINEVMLLREYG